MNPACLVWSVYKLQGAIKPCPEKSSSDYSGCDRSGVLLNVDSIFNMRQTIDVCKAGGYVANVLFRINPDINPVYCLLIFWNQLP